MRAESKLARVLLVSPWFLLVFLVIPFLVVLSVSLHIKIPLVGSTTPLLANNVCFAFLSACRLFRYLAGAKKDIRYGALCGRPQQSATLSLSVEDVRNTLNSAGYSFTADGNYGEKRDLGYFGTTVMYGGLFILLLVGSWDNLRHFSGVLLDGIDSVTSLNKIESYRFVNKGPLAASRASLPRMRIMNQSLPDTMYLKGATDVIFMSEDGHEQKVTLIPGRPVSYGDFDIYMAKLVFQPQIVIKSKAGITLFDELVTLDPLVQKRGAYSFYGLFQGVLLGGGVYYQPEKSMLMVVMSRDNEKVVADMTFQVDQQVEKEGYILSCSKMGQWSEIHVVHRRHKGLLVVGGIIAIIGLLLRGAIWPQRVWLEETPEGCMVKSVGNDAMSRLERSV